MKIISSTGFQNHCPFPLLRKPLEECALPSENKGEAELRKTEVRYYRKMKGLPRTLRKGDPRVACAHQAHRKACPNWCGSGGAGPS